MQVFYRKLEDIKSRDAGTNPEELQVVIDHAVDEVRRIGRTKA